MKFDNMINTITGEMVGHAPGSAGCAPFPVDVDRLLGDINRTFNPLHHDCALDFHVTGSNAGYVCLSVALPEGMTRAFVTLLESLYGFMRVVDIKSRSAVAQAKVVEPGAREKRDRLQADFEQEVCTVFDGFILQGIEKKEAVKLTNSALKAKGSPWSTYEVVKTTLSAAGRFRKRGDKENI
jgi:hypothetical protein